MVNLNSLGPNAKLFSPGRPFGLGILERAGTARYLGFPESPLNQHLTKLSPACLTFSLALFSSPRSQSKEPKIKCTPYYPAVVGKIQGPLLNPQVCLLCLQGWKPEYRQEVEKVGST